MKPEGKIQRRIKQELKLKPCSSQTRTHKDKNHPSTPASLIWFPEYQH